MNGYSALSFVLAAFALANLILDACWRHFGMLAPLEIIIPVGSVISAALGLTKHEQH